MSEAAVSPLASTGGRYALVVGVNAAAGIVYPGPLRCAEDHARAMAEVLREVCGCTLLGDAPLLGAQATIGAVRATLNTLALKRTDDDLLIFYFAGHGMLHEDGAGQRQVYLVTTDFDTDAIKAGEDTDSISLGWLQERLYAKTKAGCVLLLLDCCYAGNAGRVSQDLPLDSMSTLFKQYLGATLDTSKSTYRVTIAATGHDAEAWEHEQNGAMTPHLVSALRGECRDAYNDDGEVTVGRLYDFLNDVLPAGRKPSFSGDTAGRGLVLATHRERSAQALQAQQQAEHRRQRDEFLHALSTAPEGERFLRGRLESFVGRGQELLDIEQRITAVQPGGGYLTITGLAGEGKSSIIAAAIARMAPTPQQREQLPFHFIPFNPGPDYQVSLLRNLMARLILKYGLSDLYVASPDRPTLREFFPKVLRDVAAQGGQEVIFIDGLDQIESDANGVRDLTFLPPNPPEGIVFVLGTRPDDALTPLTLLKPAQAYRLPSLSREDFVLLLERRQAPAMEPRFVEQLYEKMQQNALYLDLLARELHDQGAIAAGAIEAIIRRLTEDPDNIFSLALERLARHREDWREVIQPLLGVLLVVYEPLTPWQLRTILHLDHWRVQRGLEYLSGLVSHVEQRYALYHLKFRDFLRQDETRLHKRAVFASDEEANYHAWLAQWCEHDQLSIIWQESQDAHEQSRRLYARRHYVSHLYGARQWERLFAVLDERSYGQAKERDDIENRAYLEDLRKGCQAASWDGWNHEQYIAYLPRLWRYTLLRCSIRSTVDGYPLELFEAMLAVGREREVAGLIGLLTKPAKKTKMLLLLAQHLLPLPGRRQEAITTYLRAEEVAHSIKDLYEQGQALVAVMGALAEVHQWEHVAAVAHSIEDSYAHVQALAVLVTALVEAHEWEQAGPLLSHTEAVARSIKHSDEQVQALVVVTRGLVKAHKWERAEVLAHSIEDSNQQGRALVVLTRGLAEAHEWEQAEAVARSIEDSNEQVQALAALAITLAEAHEWQQARSLLSEAEAMARSIKHIYEQVQALAVLTRGLAEAHEWKQAEAVARSINDSNEQVQALVAVTRGLAETHEWEQARYLLSQVEVVARSIKNSNEQAQALVVMTRGLTEAHEWEQAKAVALSINDPNEQVRALAVVATALAEIHEWEQARRLLSQTEAMLRSIKDLDQQGQALVALTTALAEAHEWHQAEAVVRSIKHPDQQVQALVALTTALTKAHEWEQAEAVARSINDSDGQRQALAALATALTEAHEWHQAEAVVRSIKHPGQQGRALAVVATALAEAHEWERAEAMARSIKHPGQQGRALVALATALAEAHEWHQAEAMARSFEGLDEQRQALAALATALTEAHEWGQAEAVAGSIENSNWQMRTLVSLATALIEAHEWHQAEAVAGSIENSYGQVQALAELATALARQGHFPFLLSLMQRSWQRVETREDALRLFPLVTGLIAQTPSLGMELYQGFQWVDDFLRGG